MARTDLVPKTSLRLGRNKVYTFSVALLAPQNVSTLLPVPPLPPTLLPTLTQLIPLPLRCPTPVAAPQEWAAIPAVVLLEWATTPAAVPREWAITPAAEHRVWVTILVVATGDL